MLSVNFIMSQVMGLLATLILCSSYIVKNKEKFLFLGIVGDLVYGLSFVFVNSIGTGIITILSCIQSTSFYYCEKHNKKMPVFVAGIFISLFLIAGILNMDSLWDIVPIVVCVYYTFALYAKDLKKIRMLYIIPNAILIAYDIVVTAYASAFEDGFEATFLAIILVTDYAKNRKKISVRKIATLKQNSRIYQQKITLGLQSNRYVFETSDNNNYQKQYTRPFIEKLRHGHLKPPGIILGVKKLLEKSSSFLCKKFLCENY